MRRPQPRPKDRRPVPIPPELRAAVAEVHHLIRQARRDPDVDLSRDDAIQAGDGLVCGGRFGAKHRPYVLTDYPAGEAERGRWSRPSSPPRSRTWPTATSPPSPRPAAPPPPAGCAPRCVGPGSRGRARRAPSA